MEDFQSSKLSKVIATNTAVEQLAASDVPKITSCLMKVLDCESESEFLSTILLLIYPTLSHGSLSTLQTTALGLLTTIKNETNTTPNATIYIGAPDSPASLANHMSWLSSDTFDLLGSFLSTHDRLTFGYVNRQCYVESQKRSFMLQSQNEDKLVLDRVGIISKAYNFAFCVPNKLALEHTFNAGIYSLVSSVWFASLFTCLTELKTSLMWMPYIPVHTLFKSNNKHLSLGRINQSFDFIINICTDQEEIGHPWEKFLSKYQEFEMKSGNNTAFCKRSISSLILVWDSNRLYFRRTKPVTINVKPILCGLTGNYSHLMLKTSARIRIDTFDELKSIFHPNLKSFGCDFRCHLSFEEGVLKRENSNKEQLKNVSKLNEITLVWFCQPWDIDTSRQRMEQYSDMLDGMDRLRMRSDVTRYIIKDRRVNFVDPDMLSAEEAILDKLFFGTGPAGIETTSKRLTNIKFLITESTYDPDTMKQCFRYLIRAAPKLRKLHEDCNLECVIIEQCEVDDFSLFECFEDDHSDWFQHGDMEAAQRWIEDPANLEKFNLQDVDVANKVKNITMDRFDFSSRSFSKLIACLQDMYRRYCVSKQSSKHPCEVVVTMCLQF